MKVGNAGGQRKSGLFMGKTTDFHTRKKNTIKHFHTDFSRYCENKPKKVV